jgi:hypothetical protein
MNDSNRRRNIQKARSQTGDEIIELFRKNGTGTKIEE